MHPAQSSYRHTASGAEDAEGVAADERFGDLGPGPADDAVEGLARDAHPVGGVLAVEALDWGA